MSNPFSNVDRTVETYSFNKTNSRPIDKMSDIMAAHEALRKVQLEEAQQTFEYELDLRNREAYYNKLNTGVVNRYVKESQIPNNINRISIITKEAVLKDILFEVFYNSLLMDDDFLKENVNAIKALTDKYVDDHGGFSMLDKTINNTTFSPEYLKKMKKVCENMASTVCNRKIRDSKDCSQVQLIDFDMTAEEKEKLDKLKIDDLNVDRISELVKDKVLTVVKDEKEKQAANSELMDNIENDLKTDENVIDDKTLNEAMSKLVLNTSVIEESTLFDSLFRDCYHEYILENVAITSTDKDIIDDHNEMSKNYDTEMDIDNALSGDDDVHNTEVNMDLILTEAITKYTLMETLYTLGLENYTHDNIKKLTQRMLNPVIETAVAPVEETEEFQKNRKIFFGHFSKLRDDPSNETARDNMSRWFTSACTDKVHKDECAKFVKLANAQIDGIIEKNPKMKDKYTDLSTFMNSLIK